MGVNLAVVGGFSWMVPLLKPAVKQREQKRENELMAAADNHHDLGQQSDHVFLFLRHEKSELYLETD